MLRLPSSQYQEIASFYSPRDLFASKRVCKRFAEEFSRPLIWDEIVKKRLPTIMRTFEVSSEILVKSICNKDEPIEFILTCEKKDGGSLPPFRIPLTGNTPFAHQPLAQTSWENEFTDTATMDNHARAEKVDQLEIRVYCIFEK